MFDIGIKNEGQESLFRADFAFGRDALDGLLFRVLGDGEKSIRSVIFKDLC